MLRPVNDHGLIEIETNKYGNFVSNEPPKGYESGVLIAISDVMPFFGANSYVFEDSLFNTEVVKKVKSIYEPLIGKKVFWPEYSDRGVVIEHGNKTYCLMKLSLLTAFEEGEE